MVEHQYLLNLVCHTGGEILKRRIASSFGVTNICTAVETFYY